MFLPAVGNFIAPVGLAFVSKYINYIIHLIIFFVNNLFNNFGKILYIKKKFGNLLHIKTKKKTQVWQIWTATICVSLTIPKMFDILSCEPFLLFFHYKIEQIICRFKVYFYVNASHYFYVSYIFFIHLTIHFLHSWVTI